MTDLGAIINSFFLVLASEMGDKTQLLALVLAARFRKPMPIMAGILVATLVNHGLASWLGGFLASFIAPDTLRLLLMAIFIAFAIWILIPDKDEEMKETSKWGAFLTTCVVFFLAEMGDKTQLATVALGAQYAMPVSVTLGTTLGMLVADGLAVFFGEKFTKKVPMKTIRVIAAALFMVFGVFIWLMR